MQFGEALLTKEDKPDNDLERIWRDESVTLLLKSLKIVLLLHPRLINCLS